MKLSGAEERRIYLANLDSLSTDDGREVLFTYDLRQYLSEKALHRYRALIMIELLIALSEARFPKIPLIGSEDKALMRSLVRLQHFDANAVAEYDHFGRNGLDPVEHDVKACEYYLRERFDEVGLSHWKEWLYFPMTSEDCSNLAWNLMLRDAVNNEWLPTLLEVADKLAELSVSYAHSSVLGITHNVKASPTTTGKRFSQTVARILEVLANFQTLRLGGKFSGAVGNNNPMKIIAPEFDFRSFARSFVQSFGFVYLDNTFQRNPHVEVVRLLHNVKLINLHVADLCENIGRNIALGWYSVQAIPGQSGSSIMSNKINDWRDEVATGYFEQSNSLINGAEPGLLLSAQERDASDHPGERAYGSMIGKSLCGLKYVALGLGMLRVEVDAALRDLESSPEVLSEVIQLSGRTCGVPGIYDIVRDTTRGRIVTAETIADLIRQHIPDPELATVLLALTPAEYTGDAADMALTSAHQYRLLRPLVQRGLLDSVLKLEAVLCDFDGTLHFGDKDELQQRLEAISGYLCLGFTTDEIREFGNRSDWLEMIALMLKAYHKSRPGAQIITEEQFEQANLRFSGQFDHCFKRAEYAQELLSTLRSLGKKIGLVTTRGSNSLMRLLRLHGIADYFDVIVNRADCEARKPDPSPLILALKRLEVHHPPNAMYVGDKQVDDIVPANALGMESVLVNSDDLDHWGALPTHHFTSLLPLYRLFERHTLK